MRVIVTGATGMVGEGVMHECLLHPDVEKVSIVNRRASGHTHPKLEEIVHGDFADLASIRDRLRGHDACFFCSGVSSVGMSEEAYSRVTHDLTLSFARTLSELNPAMVFVYVSGSGTDGSAQGRVMWARVKGRTENDLLALPFAAAYMFRPGYMHPTPGLKNTLRMVRAVSWLYPVARPLFPGVVCTLREVGLAMIHAAQRRPEKRVLEVRAIVELAK